MRSKRVCVIGLGYIGLPTAALLAHHGYKVSGVDLNPKIVNAINQGQTHISEPDLEGYVQSSVASGKLRAFLAPQASDIYIICVPTPFYKNESSNVPQPNLEYVHAAAKSIADLIKPDDYIILESTSPVGTTESLARLFTNSNIDISKIKIAYCPERVLPGKIMVELVENDRIVGGLAESDSNAIGDFYKTFVRGNVLKTSASLAEMCKLAENSYRDVNIAFANELSILCFNQNINPWEVVKLANRHPRVNILQPGVGVGGHCIAVDPWFIVAKDPSNARLIKTARVVNDDKTQWVINQILYCAESEAKQTSKIVRIACLGVAFKPDVDDLRESPAILVVDHLVAAGYDAVVVEPNIQSHERYKLSDLQTAISECQIVVVLVGHREFIGIKDEIESKNKIYLNFCTPN